MPAHYAANETSSFFIRTRTRVRRCYFSVNFCQAASLCAVLFGGGDGDLKDRFFFSTSGNLRKLTPEKTYFSRCTDYSKYIPIKKTQKIGMYKFV